MVVMRGLILVSVIWTDLVKTLPVEDKNMYETFLSGNSKLKSCSNFNVAVLKTDIFKGICSLPSPNIEDFSQSQDKIKESMKFNLSPLLCYSIFHNVYAVCHPDTKISVKAEPKSTKPSDQFCENIPTISLPETCTHWLEDPNHTSKDDCFLVNEVVAAVLNNKGFCENKCLVPDPGKDVAPSVNPLCEQLLATSKILAQMSPKGPDSDVKPGINSSSSDIDLSIPPGLTKQKEATESIVVKENVNEGAKQEGLQPKSGESSSLSFNEDKEIEDSDVKENIKDKSKPVAEKEVAPKGEIDSKPLVSVEEETKADDANDKEDVAVEKPSKDVTESKIEPAMPNNEKEIVETKYENNMKTGPEIDEQSSFFGYFILLSIVAIIAYLVFHNKQKILALVLEGRRRQGNRRRSGGREYRKLDSNLEDTMDPGKETSLRQVIY